MASSTSASYSPRALSKPQPLPLKVLVPLFPDFNTFDANGPIEVLATANRIPSAGGRQFFQITTTAQDELTKSIEGVSLARDVSLAEALERLREWDIMLLPGGVQASIMAMFKTWKADPLSLNNQFISLLDRYSELEDGLMLSVCTGSLFLAALGKLNGPTATTHFASLPLLKKLCQESKMP